METNRVDALAGSVVTAPDLTYRPPDDTPTAPGNELGKDEFLQLLVAQLKYQDPLEPSSSEEFISTTAQFTVVEKLDELTKQGESTALVQSLTTASSLVGREVTANLDGALVDAVVDNSRIVGGQVVLDSSAGEIRLEQIVSVGAMQAPELNLAPNTPPVTAPEPVKTPASDETTAVDEADVVVADEAVADEAVADEAAADEAAVETTPATETTPAADDVDTSVADETVQPVIDVADPAPANPDQADPVASTPPVTTNPLVTPDNPASTSTTTTEPEGTVGVDPIAPVADPAVPAIDSIDPVTDPAVPATDATAPVADPIAATDPVAPVVDPADSVAPGADPIAATDPVAPAPETAPSEPAAPIDTPVVTNPPVIGPDVLSAIQALADPAVAQAVQLLSNPAIVDAVRVLSDPAVRQALDSATDIDGATASALAASQLLSTLNGLDSDTSDAEPGEEVAADASNEDQPSAGDPVSIQEPVATEPQPTPTPNEVTPTATAPAATQNPGATQTPAVTQTPTGQTTEEVTDPFDPFDPLG